MLGSLILKKINIIALFYNKISYVQLFVAITTIKLRILSTNKRNKDAIIDSTLATTKHISNEKHY